LACRSERLLASITWIALPAREVAPADPPRHRHVRPLEKKESYRGLASLKTAQPVRGKTQLVRVGDREADIDDLFQLSAARAAPGGVRANYDRPINKRSM
jgi:hypothetical protein